MPQERNEASKLFLCDVASQSTLKALMCKTVQCSGVLSLNRQLEILNVLAESTELNWLKTIQKAVWSQCFNKIGLTLRIGGCEQKQNATCPRKGGGFGLCPFI